MGYQGGYEESDNGYGAGYGFGQMDYGGQAAYDAPDGYNTYGGGSKMSSLMGSYGGAKRSKHPPTIGGAAPLSGKLATHTSSKDPSVRDFGSCIFFDRSYEGTMA